MSIIDDLSSVLGSTVNKHLEVSHWLSTGFPPLDKIISGSYDGGMPCGRLVEMFGPASCGKTAISTNVMKNAIDAGGVAFFMDHERSFDIGLARTLGLDDASGRFAHVRPDTFEDSMVKAINSARLIREGKKIPEDAPIVVVFDSLAAMVPKSKIEKELDEATMADALALAKATSQSFPTLNLMAEKYNMLVLILNQLRESPASGPGDNTRTPGGRAPAFYASVRIKLGARQVKDGTERVGHTIVATTVKNKVSAPFLTAQWNFMYQEDGSGKFDVARGMVDHAADIGALETTGNYVVWKGKKYYRKALGELVEAEDLVGELVELCKAHVS